MKTELKDVIHFYIGCEAIADETRFKIHGVEFMDAGTFINSESTECWRMESCDFKLILRNVLDIKEREIIEMFSFLKGGVNVFRKDNIRELSPEKLLFLLKNGFDLFGLIENGYAIDKTKIK